MILMIVVIGYWKLEVDVSKWKYKKRHVPTYYCTTGSYLVSSQSLTAFVLRVPTGVSPRPRYPGIARN